MKHHAFFRLLRGVMILLVSLAAAQVSADEKVDVTSGIDAAEVGDKPSEVFRGGTYITGPSSTQSAGEGSKTTIEIPPLSYPDWQAAKERIKEILKRAEVQMMQGDEAGEERVLDEARDIAGKVIAEFLQIPVPPNPCDETYTDLLFDLAQTEMMGLTHAMPAEAEQFQERLRTVFSLCTARYELEIDYRRRTDHGPYQTSVQVSGRIPVTMAVDGPDDEGLYHLRGYGNLDVAGSGRSGDCSVDITGWGDVEVAGRFGFDKEKIGMTLALRHNITERHSMHCPHGTGVTDSNEWTLADRVIEIIPKHPVEQTHTFLGGIHTMEMTWTLRPVK